MSHARGEQHVPELPWTRCSSCSAMLSPARLAWRHTVILTILSPVASMASPAFNPPPAPASPTSHLIPSSNRTGRSTGFMPHAATSLNTLSASFMGVADSASVKVIVPPIIGRWLLALVAEGPAADGLLPPGAVGCGGAWGRERLVGSARSKLQHSHPIPQPQLLLPSIDLHLQL